MELKLPYSPLPHNYAIYKLEEKFLYISMHKYIIKFLRSVVCKVKESKNMANIKDKIFNNIK